MPADFLDLPTEIHERIFDLLRRSYINESEIAYNEDGLGILPPCRQLAKMPLICTRLRDPATKALYYSINLWTSSAPEWQDRFTANPKLGGYVREFCYDPEEHDCGRVIVRQCPVLRRLACSASAVPLVGDMNGLESLLVWLTDRNVRTSLHDLLKLSMHIPSLGIYTTVRWPTEQIDASYSQGALSADSIYISNRWTLSKAYDVGIASFLAALARPPSSVSINHCRLLDRQHWERCLACLADLGQSLKSLTLHISDNFGRPGEWEERDRILIPAFKFGDLSGFKQLESLSLTFVSIEEDEFCIPESVKHLKLTWHLSAWPFWEPISQGLQQCQQLPALEIIAIDNWRHIVGEDSDEDTLESLVRDFGAITAISVIYGLEGQSITPKNLTDFWLQHQEKALPEYLFNRLVATCQSMVDSLTEEPENED